MRRPISSFMRFAVVGVASNGLLYLAYIGLTLAGLGHKSAMTLCFAAGVVLSFALNRNWSFKSTGPVRRAFVRYAVAYAGGYLLNLLGLIAFVDWWGFRHEIVQALLIAVVAVLMFIAQTSWIFRDRAGSSLPRSEHPAR